MAYVVQRTRHDGATRYLACYRDPEGRIRSAGTHATRRTAERAAHREEQKVLAGSWRDATLGAISFHDYVEHDWLPSKHIEPTTKAAYASNLNRHFYPFFGKKLMYQITPSLVQDWVTQAAAEGLSPRSIRKYHTMLHSIFKRAVRDSSSWPTRASTPSCPRSSRASPAPSPRPSTTCWSTPSRTGTGSWSRPRSRPACAGESSSPSGPDTSTSSENR